MRKNIAALGFALVILLTGCAGHGAGGTVACTPLDTRYRLKQIQMCGPEQGWALTTENELLFTRGGTGRFFTVRQIGETDSRTEGFVSAFFLDEQRAYLAYFSPDQEHLVVEHTGDGGSTWQETLLDYGSYGDACDAGSVYLSFKDEKTGWLLYCSTPGARLMTKLLFVTFDGGESFSLKADLSEEITGYPQGISFQGEKGYIGAAYHGDNGYLYETQDGGATWDMLEIQPLRRGVNYVDGYAPVFNPQDNRGMLVLKEAGEEVSYRMYTLKEGEESWEEAGKIQCRSLGSYGAGVDGSFFLLDTSGQLYGLEE